MKEGPGTFIKATSESKKNIDDTMKAKLKESKKYGQRWILLRLKEKGEGYLQKLRLW